MTPMSLLYCLTFAKHLISEAVYTFKKHISVIIVYVVFGCLRGGYQGGSVSGTAITISISNSSSSNQSPLAMVIYYTQHNNCASCGGMTDDK